MMGVKIVYRGERITVEADVGDKPGEVGLFKAIASIAKVAEVESCGMCGSDNVYHAVRKAQEYEFLELRCQDCDAQLQFHKNKEGGGLYVKRGEGKNGWYVYEGNQNTEYSQPASSEVSPPASDADTPF